MKKDTRIIIGICIIFLAAAGFLFWRQQRTTAVFSGNSAFVLENSPTEKTDTSHFQNKDSSNAENRTEEAECAVYVSGAVKKPGLFRYNGTARLCDAIEAAGGFSKKADRNSVNPARILTDGEQIIVQTKKETASKKNASVSDANNKGQENSLIDINKASLEELMTLPGVGEAKAGAIIAYRQEHGPFAVKEDLMNISGIKEGVYNKIKNFIVIT